MPGGKKSNRALMSEQGLARTENGLPLTSWPFVPGINQKNYYTDYLKRDEQHMVLREAAAEAQHQQAVELEKKREAGIDPSADLAGDPLMDDGEKDPVAEEEAEVERYGNKIVVLHMGSQNLRLGFASDALPKTVPMCIARKAEKCEAEAEERCPKRRRLDSDGLSSPKDLPQSDNADQDAEALPMWKEPEFDTNVTAMTNELKVRMRSNKRRMQPNSKEQVYSFNRRAAPEVIREHNDPYRVDWTEVTKEHHREYYVGEEALRIPDKSDPRYRLYWPIRYGWYNERDYTTKRRLLADVQTIIEYSIHRELNLERKELSNYRVVLVVPDLYERNNVTDMMELLMREIRFAEVCIIQESLAATFGAGFSAGCIVDIGAQKTSVCCVEEGMCLPESRLNMKFGGQDVSLAIVRLLLNSSFPYAEINLNLRHDFLLAETLKTKYQTLNDGDIMVSAQEFFLRRPNKDTRKYTFRMFDEPMLAPMLLFNPSVFEQSYKLDGRRSLCERSYDLYDGNPNDPISSAQAALYQSLSTKLTAQAETKEKDAEAAPKPVYATHLNAPVDATPRSSVAGSPAPDFATPGAGTPSINERADPMEAAIQEKPADAEKTVSKPEESSQTALWDEYDRIVPLLPLERAIINSITHAAKGDDKKARDFLGSIMVVGGGSMVPGLNHYLEEKLKIARPDWAGSVGITPPPRELEPSGITWKGASVFGKLRHTNDSWIRQREYDILGSRLLTVKCMFNF